MVKIIPHLSVGDNAAGEVLLALAQSLGPCHYVADAAFGSEDLLLQLTELEATGTFSCSVNKLDWLWNLLSWELSSGHWRAAFHPETGIVASIHAGLDGNNNNCYQQILSTGMGVAVIATEEDEIMADSEQSDEDREEESDSNGASEVEDDGGTSNDEEKSDQEALEEEDIQNSSKVPILSRETLEKMTVKKMTALCKRWNIRKGKLKADMVENIFQRSQTVHQKTSKVEKIEEKILESELKDPAPLHQLYKKWFNLVDKVNKQWYEVKDNHGLFQWRTAMTIGILRYGVWNAWAHSVQLEYIEWIKWRENIAKRMMKHYSKF